MEKVGEESHRNTGNRTGRNCIVTGAAGFIGSRLSEKLLEQGWHVKGIDAFTDSYSIEQKLERISNLTGRIGFSLIRGDLVDLPLGEITEDVDVVFHLAGRAGVRPSFGLEPLYIHDNVTATKSLLAAARSSGVSKLVYASSSSVYGNAPTPFREQAPTGPISPYGRTKLEAEELCLSASSTSFKTIALRYFTVYGPGQRPDMGIRLFAEAALSSNPIRLLGDGTQRRDFTYVDDIVDATIRAATSDANGLAINIGGGSSLTILEVLAIIEDLAQVQLQIQKEGFARGDVRDTEADLTRARTLLGFTPKFDFRVGLAKELEWLSETMATTTMEAK